MDNQHNVDPMMMMAQAVNRVETSQKELVEYVNGLRNALDAIDGIVFYLFGNKLKKDFKYTDKNVELVQAEIQKVKDQAQKYIEKKAKEAEKAEEKSDGGDKKAK